MKVSIIIVNYRVKEDLFTCLESIYNSKPGLRFEIIVVDNDEKKTLGKDLKRKFPKVKYIKSKGNIGYGAGNNLGAKYASGEYLFILNPDTKIIEGNISKLIRLSATNNKTGVVAPLLLDEKAQPYALQGTKELTPKKAIFALSFVSKLLPNNKIYQDYYNASWNKKNLKEVDVAPGTAFLIKREQFEEVGGFDENFFLFFEEFDLCKRIRKLGLKIYISPKLKVMHKWGESTSKNKDSQKYFEQSRYYYFKKNYGILKAIGVEFFLRLNKQIALLALIVSLALFLRLYRLAETMPFIPDIAWFYVSAKDMIIGNEIPLVGIASSHPWLHQGAIWTYILGIILALFNFNPIAPSYFTAILDVATILFVYYFAKRAFGERIALISSFFYATSPLIIFSAQTPYHTSLIPFFTILLLISVLNWIKKSQILFFPVCLFLLAILYNLELATFSLTATFLMIFIYGFLKRKNWVIGLKKPKIVGFSILAFTIPMIPMLLYDLRNGFPQTVKFLAWVLYRIAVFLGFPPLSPNASAETWNIFFKFILDYIGRFYFIKNDQVALIILISIFMISVWKLLKSRFKDLSLGLVLIFFTVPGAAYIAAKTNSAAYLPMIFPQAAILLGFSIGSFKKYSIFAVIILIIIVGLNLHNFYKRDYFDTPLSKRLATSKEIVIRSNGRAYNILEKDKASGFEDFIKNYEYLAWWLGHGPSKKDEKLKYYINENSSKIIVDERIEK